MAIGLVAFSFAIFVVSASNIVGLVIRVVVLDIGLQIGQTPNQSRAFALRPEARSRLNAVYVVCYFFGGAAGSALGALAWQIYGWTGVCFEDLTFSAIAAISHYRGH